MEVVFGNVRVVDNDARFVQMSWALARRSNSNSHASDVDHTGVSARARGWRSNGPDRSRQSASTRGGRTCAHVRNCKSNRIMVIMHKGRHLTATDRSALAQGIEKGWTKFVTERK